jgi:hypothetical protein
METWDIRKTVGLVVSLLLATVAALYWSSIAQRPKGTDVEQIRLLLVRGEQALEKRHLSEAMALVSKKYHDDEGLGCDSLRALTGRQLREARTVDINIPAHSLHIQLSRDGRRAVAQAHVDLRAASRYDTTFDQSADLSLEFVKEPVHYYLMFPGEEWRLVKMGGYQAFAGE